MINHHKANQGEDRPVKIGASRARSCSVVSSINFRNHSFLIK